jgi:large subunit ribosomal protein L10
VDRVLKEQQIAELKADFVGVQGAVLADFKGLTVRDLSEIRRAFREQGVSLRVVKNTLARIASEGTKLEVIKGDFIGTTAIAFSKKDAIAPARVAEKCAKDKDKFVIKGGYVDGSRINAQGVEQLAKLPSANELRATLLSLLNAPATQLVRVFNAVPQKVALVLDAQRRKLNGEE